MSAVRVRDLLGGRTYSTFLYIYCKYGRSDDRKRILKDYFVVDPEKLPSKSLAYGKTTGYVLKNMWTVDKFKRSILTDLEE